MKTTRLWVLILSMALSGCASGYYQAGYGGYSGNAYTAPRSSATFEYGYVAPVAPIIHHDSYYLSPRHGIPHHQYRSTPHWGGHRWHHEPGGHGHGRGHGFGHRHH